MLKIDFLNNNYSIAEIIEAYTDGDIANFKGDEDFLTFLISYAIGECIEGPDSENFKEYAEYEGVLNLMLLDEYGYLGTKLYKLYEICGKNKDKFILLCGLIGKYRVVSILDKSLIDRNLELSEPVDFLDENIVLSSGTKPNLNPKSSFPTHDLSFDDRKEYEHELERSLKRRINESIKKNNDDLELFPEMPSYVEMEKQKREAAEAKRVKDDYSVNINNLFYGAEDYDVSGGVLNFCMRTVSWFEYTNTDLLNLHIFRSIPTGDYCLLDDNAKIYIPETLIQNGNVKVGPNSPIRSVKIANVPTILQAAIKKLEEDPILNENSILNLKSLLETLEIKESVLVGDLKGIEDVIRASYELAFGEIFPQRDGEAYSKSPDGIPR